MDKIIQAEEVADYLNKNREFFHVFPSLLKDLSIPHVKSGKAISLLEHQIFRLRTERDSLQIEVDTLKDIAGENGVLLNKVYKFANAMLAAQSDQAAIDIVYASMRELFEVEQVAMVSWDVPLSRVTGINQLGFSQDWSFALKTRLESTVPVCGLLENEWQKGLFQTNDNMESVCILPLGHKRIWGVLALGSTSNRFNENLGTYFLQLMSNMVTERLKHLFE